MKSNNAQASVSVVAGATPIIGTMLKAVLARCENFISGFEDDPDQEGIKELLRDLRTTITDQMAQPTTRGDLLESGVEAAQNVIDNWSKGDLAGAVNQLEGWIDEVSSSTDSEPSIVVVELVGGNVSNVSANADLKVLVLDYDNGADDADSEPVIPMRDEDRASISEWDRHRGEDDGFCLAVYSALQRHELADQAASAWFNARTQAEARLADIKVHFKTWLQQPTGDIASHTGQDAVVTGLLVGSASVLPSMYDEEALPFVRIKFLDGVEVDAEIEELSGNEESLNALTDFSKGFSHARDFGYTGVDQMFDEASVDEMTAWMNAMGFAIE